MDSSFNNDIGELPLHCVRGDSSNFGNHWQQSDETGMVGEKFNALEIVHIGGEYEVLVVNCA